MQGSAATHYPAPPPISTQFQAIVDLRQGRIVGHEALSRGPEGPLHHPQALFEHAYENGWGLHLEQHCAELACRRFTRDESLLFVNVNSQLLLDASHRQHLQHYSRSLASRHSRLVLELSEQHGCCDTDALNDAIRELRKDGIRIAIDDLGLAHSGLQRWLLLRSDYVKIDRFFCQYIDRNPDKCALLSSLIALARHLGTTLIAEGVERPEEALRLQELGIDLMQGYYFQRPGQLLHSLPPQLMSPRQPNTAAERTGDHSIASLIRPTAALPQHTRMEEIVRYFQQHPELDSLPLIENGMAVGAITRRRALEVFSSDFGRELYGRKTVAHFMERDTVIVEHSTLLEDVSYQLTDASRGNLAQEFIAVDRRRYLGTVRTSDLLRRITDQQIRNARYANPLTGLPGNVPINEHIEALLISNADFAVAYCDINDFKAYNDAYGYAMGDKAISILARQLQELSDDCDFVGHVGGDDFIAVLQSPDFQLRCEELCQTFSNEAAQLYTAEHQQLGGIWSHDRQGKDAFFSTMSLSIGIVTIGCAGARDAHEVSSLASEAKKSAKNLPGGGVYLLQPRSLD